MISKYQIKITFRQH